MELEKLLVNYKIKASCQANMSSKALFRTFQTTKLNLKKLFVLLNSSKIFSIFYVSLNLVIILIVFFFKIIILINS